MSQKKKSPPARPRSLGKKFSVKALTFKQAAFLKHFLNPKSPAFGNRTRAAELAGYKGAPGSNQLAVQGSRNCHNRTVRSKILAALEERGFDADSCARILKDASLATKVQVLPNRRGKSVPVKLPDHATRLKAYDKYWHLVGEDRPAEERSMDEFWGPPPHERAGLKPYGQNMSEEASKLAEEYAACTPAERMLMREGYETALRISELMQQQAREGAQKSFAPLKSLAGTWHATETAEPPSPEMANGAKMQVKMRVTSCGEMLVHEVHEYDKPDDPKYSLITFSVDGHRVLLTHHGDVGKGLRLVGKSSPDGKTVEFEPDPLGGTQAERMQHVIFTVIDANHYTEDWTYMMPGEEPLRIHRDLKREQ